MNNKRGLSTVVTTLIIIALSLVAVGIIWVVVQNVMKGQTENINYQSKCLDLNVRANAVNCTIPITNPASTEYRCSVTLVRQAGTESFAGVRLLFSDASGKIGTDNEDGNIEDSLNLGSVDSGLITAPTKVDVVVYFEDASKNKQLCQGSTTFTIPAPVAA